MLEAVLDFVLEDDDVGEKLTIVSTVLSVDPQIGLRQKRYILSTVPSLISTKTGNRCCSCVSPFSLENLLGKSTGGEVHSRKVPFTKKRHIKESRCDLRHICRESRAQNEP